MGLGGFRGASRAFFSSYVARTSPPSIVGSKDEGLRRNFATSGVDSGFKV